VTTNMFKTRKPTVSQLQLKSDQTLHQTVSSEKTLIEGDFTISSFRQFQWLGRCTSNQEVAGSLPVVLHSCNDSGQVVHTHVPLSPSSIIWYQPKGCVDEKVTVGLTSRCVYGCASPTGSIAWKGDEHPAYTPVEYGTFTFYF